jgi:hypothetical protein
MKGEEAMKQRMRFTLVVSAMALSILACQVGGIDLANVDMVRGSGNVVEETREVSGITGVNLATSGNLFIELGDTESLRIEAEDNLMEYHETEVLGGILRIRIREEVSLNRTQPVNYYLTVTGLDTIRISSSGDIEAPDLQAERFSIDISSSGDLDMGDLEADRLSVDINSSGDVRMGELQADRIEVDIDSSGNLEIAGGSVERQDISIGSSGNYTAPDLESVTAEVRSNSSGTVTIRVRDRLTANLNGSGDVRYYGNPTVDSMTNSSGDVERIGD